MSAFLGLAYLLLYVVMAVIAVTLTWAVAYRYGRKTVREDVSHLIEGHRLSESVARLDPEYRHGLDDALRITRGEFPRYHADDPTDV